MVITLKVGIENFELFMMQCVQKIFMIVACVGALGAGYFLLRHSQFSGWGLNNMSAENCIFCKIVAKQLPTTVIAENEDILVIKDIHPKAPVHYLIIPKKHIPDLQSFTLEDMPLAQSMMSMAQQLWKQGNQDFRLIMNSGKDAGQEVFHAHMHYLSGRIGHTNL